MSGLGLLHSSVERIVKAGAEACTLSFPEAREENRHRLRLNHGSNHLITSAPAWPPPRGRRCRSKKVKPAENLSLGIAG